MTDTTLRAQLIRLAHNEPALRPHLLPVLREARGWPSEEKLQEYLSKHPGAKKELHYVEEKGDTKPKVEEPPKKDDAQPTKAEKPKKRGPRFSEEELSLPWVVHQPVKDADEVFEHAKGAHEEQVKWLNQGKGLDKAIGAKVKRCDKQDCEIKYDEPGPVIVIGPPKKKERSREKVETWFGGDWSQLTDIVRASVAVDSLDEIDDVLEKLRKSGMKLAKPPTDRFTNPTPAGYRDMLLNVEYPDGHIGELQLHLKPILKAKEEGHKYYQTVRSITSKAVKEGRDTLTEEEQQQVDEANKKMKKLYDDAYAKATGQSAGKEAASHHVASTTYYRFEGRPAKWEKGKFPVVISTAGKEVVYHDLEEFFQSASTISKSDYDKAVSEGGKKKGSLREATIRLAHARPDLRPLLVPLLRER